MAALNATVSAVRLRRLARRVELQPALAQGVP